MGLTPSGPPPPDTDCFLEIEGASPSDAEAVCEAVAEELEVWLEDERASDADEAAVAETVLRELRVVAWLVSTEGRIVADLMIKLEILVTKANELLVPRPAGSQRKITPPAGVDLSQYMDFDDDESEGTVVKRSAWDRKHTTNRALKR